jgi:hypothetical protein
LFSPNLKRHTLDKIQRWALRLSGLRYTIQHISGEDNVCADLLTRWGVARSPPTRAKSVRIYRSAIDDPAGDSFEIHLRSLASDDFVWPSQSEIISIQSEATSDSVIISGSESFTRDESGLYKSGSDVI